MATAQILPSDLPVLKAPTFRVDVSSCSRHRQLHCATFAQVDITWESSRLFFLQGELTTEEVERLAEALLVDPVTETFSCAAADRDGEFVGEHLARTAEVEGTHVVDVTLLPGVTDPVAENLVRAAHLLGITGLQQAATGQRYVVQGALSDDALRRLATGVFLNPVIQHFSVDRPIAPPFLPFQAIDDAVDVIALRSADNERLLEISGQRRLALNLAEMQAIRALFPAGRARPNRCRTGNAGPDLE